MPTQLNTTHIHATTAPVRTIKELKYPLIPNASSPFITYHQQSPSTHLTSDGLSGRMGFKLHSQTPQTPPIPSINTVQVVPKSTYPHQTVSCNPSLSRNRTTRFHCSSSKRELELILDAGLLCPRRSSEEELLGPVVVVRGWRLGFSVEDGRSSIGEAGVDERWRRDRVLLRLRWFFISREGMWAFQDSRHGLMMLRRATGRWWLGGFNLNVDQFPTQTSRPKRENLVSRALEYLFTANIPHAYQIAA
jgi:hypothetical protein